MSLATSPTVRLGDLVVAAFDEVTAIVRNDIDAAKVAACLVAGMLVRTGNAPTLRALDRSSRIERVATRRGRIRCRQVGVASSKQTH